MSDTPENQLASPRGDGVNSEERQALAPVAPKRKNPIREVVETVVIALLIALVIRTFVVEVFVVDGRSMEPTLKTGERLLVNKFTYRLNEPQPGEVIVFRYPRQPDRDFIKRVMAVPGDKIEIKRGHVFVNGQEVAEPYLQFRGEGDWPVREVPPESVWVLGDNRNNSEDSRYFGEVPLKNIKGRAFFRFWPLGRWRAFDIHQLATAAE